MFGKNVKVIEGLHAGNIPDEILQSREPCLMKGLLSEWPVVEHGLRSDEDVIGYIQSFYNGRPVVLYSAPSEAKGRFFYTESAKGFNFRSEHAPLDKVLDQILAAKKNVESDTYYIGSTMIDGFLPGFRQANDLPLTGRKPVTNIWMGTATRVAAHCDLPDNLACCVAGRRRFTMFPVEQIKNLYVGPLDKTPSGQAISMVDMLEPDFESHPDFKRAMDEAIVADMEPGDALYLPSMWWHQVESFDSFNVLVNYWWRDAPVYLDAPINALHYAMLALRDLPAHEKQAWKALFDHYIFDEQNTKYDHIPEGARGFLDPLDEASARQLRSWLVNRINK